MTSLELEAAAIAACAELGLQPPKAFTRGRWLQVPLVEGSRTAGRVKLFEDGKGGIAFNWTTNERRPFFTDADFMPRKPTKAERRKAERAKRKREAERRAQYDAAAERAARIWRGAVPAVSHPYLTRKNIEAHGARLGRWVRLVEDSHGNRARIIIPNALLIPMMNASGEIRGLQAIFSEKHPVLERDKDFTPLCERAGCFWWIGPKNPDPSATVLICEGFATAATLHAETGFRVYTAFAANNLLPVARIVRERLPEADIVLCADNDQNTKGNPGITHATAAAQAINARLAVPPIDGDFNDFANKNNDIK
ncbi:toprim domain-containing protein [Methylotuvimicrobium sp.]|uniref:toprim domain-containing protein n=1 Tax=Methylotuvimicrobium sp. TaxID=2822413 RepID=UPI003D660809